jgi:hypothetical protein
MDTQQGEARSYLVKRGQDLVLGAEGDLPDAAHVFHATAWTHESPEKVSEVGVDLTPVLHAKAAAAPRTILTEGFAVVAALRLRGAPQEMPLSLYLRAGDALRVTFLHAGPLDDSAVHAVRVSGRVLSPAAASAPPRVEKEKAGETEHAEEEKEDDGDLLQLDKEAEEAFEEARVAEVAANAGGGL